MRVQNAGVNRSPKTVTWSIPKNTAVPSDRRISAPTPDAVRQISSAAGTGSRIAALWRLTSGQTAYHDHRANPVEREAAGDAAASDPPSKLSVAGAASSWSYGHTSILQAVRHRGRIFPVKHHQVTDQ